MIVLIAAGIASGLTTAAILTPVSPLAALVIAPLAASMSVVLACILIAWRNARYDLGPSDLEVETDSMVAALCEVAQRGKIAPHVAKVRIRNIRSA